MLQGKVHMAQFSVKIRHPAGSVLDEKQQGAKRKYVKAEPKGSKYCDIRYDDIDTILMVLKKAQLRLSNLKNC
jgi:hypothetical protein